MILFIYYVEFIILLLIFFSFYSYKESYSMFRQEKVIKQILSNNIYNKYFKNTRVIYKGSRLYYEGSFYHFAYVCFVSGRKYFSLINGTIFSVHFFSKYPIILYVAGNITDEMQSLFLHYDRLLVISIPCELNNIYYMKLRVSLLAPVLVGQIVESDTIVLPGADCLFERIEKEITYEYPFPMMTRHTDIRSPIKGNGTYYPLKYPMYKRTMRYMHAHMSWTYQSLPFIASIYRKTFEINYGNDEYALNVNLWESKAIKQWCTYDPLYTVVDLNNSSNIFKKPLGKITFFNFIHGCKLQTIQEKILSKLKIIKHNDFKIIYFLNNTINYSNTCKISKDRKAHV